MKWKRIQMTEKEMVEWFSCHLFECPNCKTRWTYGRTKYCPFCGQEMEEEDAE